MYNQTFCSVKRCTMYRIFTYFFIIVFRTELMFCVKPFLKFWINAILSHGMPAYFKMTIIFDLN